VALAEAAFPTTTATPASDAITAAAPTHTSDGNRQLGSAPSRKSTRAGSIPVPGRAASAKLKHRSRQRGTVCASFTPGDLVGAQLCERPLSAGKLPEAGDEEERPSDDPARGQAQGVTPTGVLELVRQHGLERDGVKQLQSCV
jgi:hypothetical protein